MAKKRKIKYNPDTLNYEEVSSTLWDTIKKTSYYLIASLVFSAIILTISFSQIKQYIHNEATKDNKNIKHKIEVFNTNLDEILFVLADIQNRDDNIYRSIFESSPYPEHKRELGTGGNSNKYKKYAGLKYGELIIDVSKKLELIEKKMVAQSISYDEVINLTKKKEEMLKAIPSIQPVSNIDLTRIASGYGYRMHPIYKIRKLHTGMDFTAPRGTEIYATGDGVVEKCGWIGGYGKCIIINHGFSYKTKYAHCSKFNCKKGQKVKRGSVIGYIGNTGQSVGPHLHYEVYKNGNHTNPVNYFFNDLTPDEYEKVLEISSRPTQSM